MTRFHFHHQCSQLNEARGWAGELILNEMRGTIFLKAYVWLSLLVNLRFEYRTIYLPNNSEFFGNPAPLGVSFTCDPTLKINVLSLPSCNGREEVKGGKDRRLRAMLHGMIRNDDFECHKNVPQMFSIVAILSQHCYPKIRRCKSPRVTSPYKIFLWTNMFLFKAVFFFLFV